MALPYVLAVREPLKPKAHFPSLVGTPSSAWRCGRAGTKMSPLIMKTIQTMARAQAFTLVFQPSLG